MDERQRKIEAGEKKLSAYKKRKHAENRNKGVSNETSSSDTSLSFSPVHLPDNSTKPKSTDNESNESEDKSESKNNSENDRSLQEMVVENVPNSTDISLKDLFLGNVETDPRINDSFISESSIISLHALERFQKSDASISDSFQNFLDEVVHDDDFEKNTCTLISKTEDYNSNTLKSDKNSDNGSLNENPQVVNTQIVMQSSVEIDSLKEIPSSNLSTVSLGTSTTEYKQCYDKNLEAVEFEDLLSHRDNQIKQLTEALQQVLEDRKNLQEQTKHFTEEINLLQEQLIQTTSIIKKHNWNACYGNESVSGNFESVVPTNNEEIQNKSDHSTSDKCIDNEKSDLLLVTNEELSYDTDFDIDDLDIISEMRDKIHVYIKLKIDEQKKEHDVELRGLRERLTREQTEHDIEIEKLRELLESVKTGCVEIDKLREELNEKHKKEMEELRTYFEQRCVVMEKNYSEEIFSQQSRKMSDSTSGSELESDVLPANAVGPSGDAVVQEPMKINLNALRLELQNKYHAELEILREDYENRVDEMKLAQEQIVEAIKEKYQNQVDSLKMELEVAQKCVAVQQEVANSGDFEIAEVVESYERRLHEQLMLAKLDIITDLEQQIQTLISNPNKDCEWPPELLQLRERLFNHWQAEMQDLKDQHNQEIDRLKQEHEKTLSRTLERERRSSLKNGDELSLRKERDNFKRISTNYRNLVAELLKYFTKCEDELNNTIVENLVKYSFDKDLSRVESDFNDDQNISCSDKSDTSETRTAKIKRVHFTPNVSGLMTLFDQTNTGKAEDVSLEFQSELDVCLERLKQEANAILCLSSNLKAKSLEPEILQNYCDKNLDEKLSSLTRQLITETQLKNDLTAQLQESKEYILNLEAEKFSLENQIEQLITRQHMLKAELDNAKVKISDLIEVGHKEIISEGYGENKIVKSTALGERKESLAELQERARNLLVDGILTTDNPVQQLIEELCGECDKTIVDAKKDHDDLIQQIEAADKKLRATTKFLEDQAVERELERDEAQREIAALKEQTLDGDRNRITCERISKEDCHDCKLNPYCCKINNTVMETVERLEVQMREMSSLMSECELKKTEVENELKEAIDKIWVLRDIIRDLETQVENKTKSEIDFKNIIEVLENKVSEQTKYAEELTQELESVKSGVLDVRYSDHITKLEDEIQRLRLSSELVGSDGALKHIKSQLDHIEKSLEKSTKDLENLYVSAGNTNCSSQSEDMSLKEQVNAVSLMGDRGDSDLPLEQLARLKDKLIRHSRAEDAAMKRIRDLEMQLFTTKQDFEEMQSERDVLQEQLSEQMIVISSLQLRLDEQRLRVESVQKQTNNSFERKIYDLENEIQTLNETVHMRDKTIKQLNSVIEQTKLRLADQQKQLNAASDVEKHIVNQVQSEIHQLKSENASLHSQLHQNSLSKSSQSSNMLPELLDTMLLEKNTELDRLKEKLQLSKKELEFYTSLNLSKEQLSNLSRSASQESKNSKKHSEILSFDDDYENEVLRKQEQSFDSVKSTENLQFKRNANETMFVGSSFRDSKFANKRHSPFVVPEVSTIEQVGPGCVNFTAEESDIKPSDEAITESMKSQKHVHFEETLNTFQLRIGELEHDLESKNDTIKSYENQVSLIPEYVKDIENLRRKLEFSEETLRETSDNYKEEIESLKNAEKSIRVELAEAKMEAQQHKQKLVDMDKDCVRKDQMYMNLAKEKRELQNIISELEYKVNSFKNYENLLTEKNKEIFNLEQQLAECNDLSNNENFKQIIEEKDKEIENLGIKIKFYENKLEEKLTELNNLMGELEKARGLLLEKDDNLNKITKEYDNLSKQCDNLRAEISILEKNLKAKTDMMAKLQEDLNIENREKYSLDSKVQDLQIRLGDYKMQLEAQRVEARKLSDSAVELERAKIRKEAAEKDLKAFKNNNMIDDLQREIHHLQELLKEKDKIINQMTVDSNSLHLALEAIQSKIQESGNVIDLKKRLRDEQSLTNALSEELRHLKQNISQYQNTDDARDSNLITNLKENLEKERNLNAELQTVRESLMNDLQQWEQKLEAEKENVSHLQILLEAEKHNSNTIQLQDANIIESMRLRLEAAMDHENEFDKMLDEERKARLDLEKQLHSLQNNAESAIIDSKLTDVNFELTCVKMDLVKAVTENEILKGELETLRNANSVNKTELRETKQLIETQRREIDDLLKKNEKLKMEEVDQKEKYKFHKREIEQRNFEIENSRMLMNELQQENKEMKKQIDELMKNLQKTHDHEKELMETLNKERDEQLKSPVPEKFLNKMRELTTLLQEHINDNKQMSSTLAQLTEERKFLQARIRDLESQKNMKSPFDDPVARADYLFGRYLKSESYRKALVFQKRYLMSLLASYQSCDHTLAEPSFALPYRSPSRATSRFRVAAIAIISIQRMKFIVQRWNAGKRIGASVILRRSANVPASASAGGSARGDDDDGRPVFGNSPPCKDRPRHRERSLGASEGSAGVSQLQAPALLSQYIERVDSIHKRLGIAIHQTPT